MPRYTYLCTQPRVSRNIVEARPFLCPLFVQFIFGYDGKGSLSLPSAVAVVFICDLAIFGLAGGSSSRSLLFARFLRRAPTFSLYKPRSRHLQAGHGSSLEFFERAGRSLHCFDPCDLGCRHAVHVPCTDRGLSGIKRADGVRRTIHIQLFSFATFFPLLTPTTTHSLPILPLAHVL